MGLITIVRHGQASIQGDDYDRLSELGRRQSLRLGEFLAERGPNWDRVLVGPLRRHRETWEAAAKAYAERERPLPEAEALEELTEHQAIAVVDHVLGSEGRQNGFGDFGDENERRERLKRWFLEFDRVMRGWVRQEIRVPDVETWQQARERSALALQRIIEESHGEANVLVFSSGGFMSMAIGSVLGLNDESVYELSLEIRNTGWAEIRFGQGRRAVRCFNSHPHLTDPEWITVV